MELPSSNQLVGREGLREEERDSGGEMGAEVGSGEGRRELEA